MDRDKDGNLIEVTAKEEKNEKKDKKDREDTAISDGEILTDWVEYHKYRGVTRRVYAWSAAEFFVELDTSGKPVACYGNISSRNFCVSAGGKFHNDAVSGAPKCTRN
jgi:hypothetical protein